MPLGRVVPDGSLLLVCNCHQSLRGYCVVPGLLPAGKILGDVADNDWFVNETAAWMWIIYSHVISNLPRNPPLVFDDSDPSNSQWPYLTLKYWHQCRRFWIQVILFDQSENVFITLWLSIGMWPYCGHFQVHISHLVVGLDWIVNNCLIHDLVINCGLHRFSFQVSVSELMQGSCEVKANIPFLFNCAIYWA